MADGNSVDGAVISVDGGDPVALVPVDAVLTGEVLPPDDPAPEGEAVRIAEIEAERDVTIAAIHAETAVELAAETTAQIEVAAEAEKEGEEWRGEMAELRENLTGLSRQVADLSLLILPQPDPEAAPEAEPADPSLSTPEFTPAPTSSTLMDPEPESADEREPDPPARRRRRPI